MKNSNDVLNYIKEAVDKNIEKTDDLRMRVTAIETHLRDMNGKLVKHDHQLTETCPLKHEKLEDDIAKRRDSLDKRIGKIEVRMAKWGGAFTVINAIIVFAINYYT